jgi:hypothetical protein
LDTKKDSERSGNQTNTSPPKHYETRLQKMNKNVIYENKCTSCNPGKEKFQKDGRNFQVEENFHPFSEMRQAKAYMNMLKNTEQTGQNQWFPYVLTLAESPKGKARALGLRPSCTAGMHFPGRLVNIHLI